MALNNDFLESAREDDYVEYFIFPDLRNKSGDEKEYLDEVLSSVLTVFRKYAEPYIWQKDEVTLVSRMDIGLPPIDDHAEKLPPHLYGVTHYGDNIEDEWFIVFLLLKATQEIPGLVARVIDADGEFLLIEAADHLPKWANPESCNKKVYLHGGAVHLIGDQEEKSEEENDIEVSEAVNRVRAQAEETLMSTVAQDAISSRIAGYPERIAENLHSCNVFVPVGVAALLQKQPSLVAPAVTAFCHRDPLDIKACRAMRFFPPEHCVLTRVVFTKCLYAMLTHQKYTPDRRTGWNLPPATDPSYNARLLGLKLACGFEILVTQSKSSGKADELDKDWMRYRQSLTQKGYFKGLLEGSQEYCSLEQTARQYYESNCVRSQPPTGKLIFQLLQELDIDAEKLRAEEKNLPPSEDDSWLDITPTQLDQMMVQRYGCKPSHPSADISSKLASFLTHVSSLDGAEFPEESGAEESPPVRPKRGIKLRKPATTPTTVSKDNEEDNDNRVSFDQEAFSCALQNILDFVVPEDNWDMESDGSGMSSYEDEVDMDLGNKTVEQAETPISELKQYMDQMDRELSSTTIGKSFEKVETAASKKGMEDSFSEVEHFEPVNIDMNALKNILESYQSQMGGAGPASNLLGPMGVRLDKE